jgi:maltose O-acetyltransferase
MHRALTPPLPRAFASFGRSFIVPPARVDGARWISIGDDVVIHEEVWLSVVRRPGDPPPSLTIGDRTRLGRFCQISCVGRIILGSDVLVSDHVQIGDTYHEYRDPDLPATAQHMAAGDPVSIGDGALLGMGVIVLPGVSIGEQAYVVEGSVVTKDVPPGAIVDGNPARPTERVP